MAGSFLPPVVATLLADVSEFKAKMREARGEMAETEDSGRGFSGAFGLAVAAAFGAVTYEAVKMGSTFQSVMETLHTQAGVPQAAISSLSSGVLQLAGQVGFAPDSLAEALYHIESSFASVGITGPDALHLLQIAAEGAATGHADLVDVTNALDAAVASGIPGVQNFSQAMGVLNATVGAGDMTMQDLAGAFSTGLLANVKSYGLSITDVGAALAVFGDNNIRGSNAATELRMAVQAMAKPAATAGGELSKLGLSTDTLAQVMSKQGLLPALDLLKKKMTAAGVTAQTQGQILTDIFGKKAGAGIVVLYDQLDRLKSKYPDLTKGANNFGDAWAATKGTFSQTMKEVQATFESLITQLGMKLMPVLTRVANWFLSSISWLEAHKAALEVVAGVIGGALVLALDAAATAALEFAGGLSINPIFLVVEAVAALVGGLIYAYNHFTTFRNIVDAVGRFLKTVFVGVWHLIGDAVKWFVDGPLAYVRARLDDFKAFWKSHGQEIMQIAKVVWTLISTWVHVYLDLIVGYVKIFIDVFRQVWKFVWDWVRNYVKLSWDVIRDVFTTAFHLILNLVGVFADLFTGHWSKLWQDVKHLVHQLVDDVGAVFSDFAKNALHLLEQAGKDIIQGLINGVKSMWNDVKSTLSSLTNAITSWKGPPEKDAVLLHGSGQLIMKGLIAGIVSQKGALRNELGNVTDMIGVGGALGALSLTGGGFGISSAGFGGGYGAAPSFTVEVYLDGQKLQGAVRKQTLRYDQRNISNGLSLAGRA